MGDQYNSGSEDEPDFFARFYPFNPWIRCYPNIPQYVWPQETSLAPDNLGVGSSDQNEIGYDLWLAPNCPA